MNSVEHCPPDDAVNLIGMENGDLHLAIPINDTIWTTKIPSNYTVDALDLSTEDNRSHFYSSIEFEPCPMPTNLRDNPDYILYYITIANIIFMGICPMIIMIVFNLLVGQN